MWHISEVRVLRMVLILIAACLGVCPAQAQYGGGSGTADDPYQIWTAEQMNAIGAEPNDWDKHFKLMADLDLSAYDGQEGRPAFNIIGTADNLEGTDSRRDLFTGVFDGNGHTISNFTHTSLQEYRYAGLFGYVAEPTGEIRNLGLIDAAVDVGSGWSVGALAGANSGVILHCYSTGSVRGTRQCVGGLVGYNYGAVVGCYSAVTVGGDGAEAGGLVGGNDEGAVIYCHSAGSVTGKSIVGGLVGYDWAGSLVHCYSTGAAAGAMGRSGGLVGASRHSMDGETTVTGCFWDVQTSGQAESREGTGLTTAQMQDMQTYVGAGWDWAGTVEDGTSDVWQMPEGGGYPVLSFFQGHTPRSLQGDGTPDNPYLISNAFDLGAMVWHNPGACYRLAAAIDLSGIRWGAPVVPCLSGTFDGNGLTISNLHVRGDSYLGLFGRLRYEAQVRDLGVVDVNVAGDGMCNCALAARNEGVVIRCFSTGRVRGGSNAGGLVGLNRKIVAHCYSAAATSGTKYAGGLLGLNWGAVTHCYSAAQDDPASRMVGTDYGTTVGCFPRVQTSSSPRWEGGQPLTVADMQDKQIYLDAGWDWVGETANGTSEVWQIPEGAGYPVLAVFGGHTRQLQGSGTSADPYLISDALDLGAATYHGSFAHYRLTAPIDLGGIRLAVPVMPLFCGVFDGDGLSISHLTIAGAGYLGLFGRLTREAEVRDLGVVDCNIVGPVYEVGALAGTNVGTIRRCYSTGAIGIASMGGGLAGFNAGSVVQCFSTSRVIGVGNYIGGLVGLNSGTLADCYSQGEVQGQMWVGGGIGENWGAVVHCYSASAVRSTDGYAGGFCESHSGPRGVITGCFWDIQTSGQPRSSGGIGKTTAEMQTAGTFLEAGWDFVSETANGTEDIWWIREGQDYPRLWWETVEE
jgi:hypothetical protein